MGSRRVWSKEKPKKEERMSKWNCKYQWELMDVKVHIDGHWNKHRCMCMYTDYFLAAADGNRKLTQQPLPGPWAPLKELQFLRGLLITADQYKKSLDHPGQKVQKCSKHSEERTGACLKDLPPINTGQSWNNSSNKVNDSVGLHSQNKTAIKEPTLTNNSKWESRKRSSS